MTDAIPACAPGLPKRIRSYRDLDVWCEAMRLLEAAYRLASRLPPDERFGLSSQLRRAAVSVAANIAEGHGRDHTGDYLRFLSYAKGSLMEVETLLLACERLSLASANETTEPLAAAARVGRMLAGLVRSLKRLRGDPLR
jgi:four helix bundle protein